MEGISDIKIVSIDSKRPPVIRKQPYIDLYFTLSHKVPKGWGEDFNVLMLKQKFKTKIQPDEGLYIETWVGKPDDVVQHFTLLKTKVAECNEQYIAKVKLKASQRDGENSALAEEPGEQGRLNRIMASLEFEE
ncbi:MAG TPA: hypothetical protein VIT83_00825 [Gammaproteobacteria bacterium]